MHSLNLKQLHSSSGTHGPALYRRHRPGNLQDSTDRGGIEPSSLTAFQFEVLLFSLSEFHGAGSTLADCFAHNVVIFLLSMGRTENVLDPVRGPEPALPSHLGIAAFHEDTGKPQAIPDRTS